MLAHNTEFPPYFFYQDGVATGFYQDFFDALSRITGDTFITQAHPMARGLMMFDENLVDIESGVNPAWRAGEKTLGLYTIPYAQSVDILLFARGKSLPVDAPSDLIGKRIGVVRGYQYPTFTKLFQSGAIERYDANGESQLLTMLLAGRLDQVIINKDLALYRMRENPAYRDLEPGFEVGGVDVMLRIHPNKAAALGRLNAAIKELIDSGEIEGIWDKYR
ncbi:substrate-binding periplasmic protein [Hahella chejuensis]|uniref:substrate-binding periplasmic protein n=1 Tax=Hahella chejuensis TaxID=158327 RepID=UPI0002F64BF6|nr:transporter substrate-binding domain-containing protein [Hahella chejuensis]